MRKDIEKEQPGAVNGKNALSFFSKPSALLRSRVAGGGDPLPLSVISGRLESLSYLPIRVANFTENLRMRPLNTRMIFVNKSGCS